MLDSEALPADFDGAAFDDWIAGATVAKRSVVIYGKPGLYAEYEQLERDLEVAKSNEEHGAELAGSEVRRIERRMRELYDEWVASKSTWIVHALDDEALTALKEQEPALVEPEAPKPPEEPVLPERPTVQQQKSHELARQAYEKAVAEHAAATKAHDRKHAAYAAEMNFRAIAAAVERVEFPDGRVAGEVSVGQLRAMHARLGEQQLLRLVTAIQLAGLTEPEIPAPFWSDGSEVDPTSS